MESVVHVEQNVEGTTELEDLQHLEDEADNLKVCMVITVMWLSVMQSCG